MSEEEKETIEDCKELVQELKQHKDKDFIGRLYYKSKPVEDILSVLLNLIEKQQKEIEEAIEYIENAKKELYGCGNYYLLDLLKILKGVKDE